MQLVLLREKGKLLLSPQQDYPHRDLQNKGIVDSGCSRHMTGNKAYLAEFQDFNGGPVAFRAAVWKSHVCITRKSWPLFKSKKIAQVVRSWIQSKNSLVKHFEDMRLCRPSKEYFPVRFDPPRDESMSCLTIKGMRNNGAMCA
ncbi:hypothetical protein Tco_0835611, partial [Tanacetum coccineum]